MAAPETIQTWADVNAVLAVLGGLDIEIAMKQAELGRQLYDLIESYDKLLGPKRAEREALHERIELYCKSRKPDFAKVRSKKLAFGKVAFKVSEKIVIPKELEPVVIATLRKLGWESCLIETVKIDKQALKKMTDNDLAKCSIKRQKEDSFRIEPNLEAVAESVGISIVTDALDQVVLDMEKLGEAVKRVEVKQKKSKGGRKSREATA